MKKIIYLITLVSFLSMSSCDALDDLLGDLGFPTIGSGDNCIDDVVDTLSGGTYATAAELDEAAADSGFVASDTLLDLWEAGQDSGIVPADANLVSCALNDSTAGLTPTATPPAEVDVTPKEPIVVSTTGGNVGTETAQVIQDQGQAGTTLEVMILLDTTGSMSSSKSAIDANLANIITETTTAGGTVSLSWYKDSTTCEGNAQGLGSMTSFTDVESDLTDFIGTDFAISGGCDLPESLFAGIINAADSVTWTAQNRLLIAITDAAPIAPDTTYDGRSDELSDGTAVLEADVVDKLGEFGIQLAVIVVGY